MILLGSNPPSPTSLLCPKSSGPIDPPTSLSTLCPLLRAHSYQSPSWASKKLNLLLPLGLCTAPHPSSLSSNAPSQGSLDTSLPCHSVSHALYFLCSSSTAYNCPIQLLPSSHLSPHLECQPASLMLFQPRGTVFPSGPDSLKDKDCG